MPPKTRTREATHVSVRGWRDLWSHQWRERWVDPTSVNGDITVYGPDGRPKRRMRARVAAAQHWKDEEKLRLSRVKRGAGKKLGAEEAFE